MDTSREERCTVPMPRIKVTNMHGFAVKELPKVAEKAQASYTCRVLQVVLATLMGVPAEVIVKTLGGCHSTVYRCIRLWNKYGLERAEEHWGGSVGCLTEEMLYDIDDAERNGSPEDRGHQQKRCAYKTLGRYIRDTYGVSYSA